MSQCVPTWDLDEIPNSFAPVVPILGSEGAVRTWENGQLPMGELGPQLVHNKPVVTASPTKSTWGEKPRAGGGTLESVVKQATRFRHGKAAAQGGGGGDDLVPWVDRPGAAAVGDALVPVGSSARVGSCSGPKTRGKRGLKRAKAARVPVALVCSSSESDSGRDSWWLTSGSSEGELSTRGFTSSSQDSPENSSSDGRSTEATTSDYRDTFCPCRSQSQRRRDKFDERMKTLQMMVPTSSKTDKVSVLDEVIEYLKQLQAQVEMMSRMNMSYMMLPMALQQHLQMSLMVSMGMRMGMGLGMGMGMGMGMGVMDMNATTGRPNITAGISPVLHPATYMPLISGDWSGNCFSAPAMVVPDSVSTYLACQSQPTMDAYNRMATMDQQLHLPLHPSFNN